MSIRLKRFQEPLIVSLKLILFLCLLPVLLLLLPFSELFLLKFDMRKWFNGSSIRKRADLPMLRNPAEGDAAK